jgi:hypothetical protein
MVEVACGSCFAIAHRDRVLRRRVALFVFPFSSVFLLNERKLFLVQCRN